MKTVPEAMRAQVAAARGKTAATGRPLPYLVQAMLGGAFIGVGVVVMVSTAGPLREAGSPWATLVQGAVFGVALTLVVTAGAELATSNMMTLTQGALGRAGWLASARTLAFSFVGNLVGAVVFAAMVHASGVLGEGSAGRAMLVGMLEHKTEATDAQLFWRGVLCNLLVCLAIWAGARLTSEGARLTVVFWALLAFVSAGFEHVVANMTTFSLGLLGGLAHVDVADLGRNLLVVGLGNLVGGALVGAAYAVTAGRDATDDTAAPSPATGPLLAPSRPAAALAVTDDDAEATGAATPRSRPVLVPLGR